MRFCKRKGELLIGGEEIGSEIGRSYADSKLRSFVCVCPAFRYRTRDVGAVPEKRGINCPKGTLAIAVCRSSGASRGSVISCEVLEISGAQAVLEPARI